MKCSAVASHVVKSSSNSSDDNVQSISGHNNNNSDRIKSSRSSGMRSFLMLLLIFGSFVSLVNSAPTAESKESLRLLNLLRKNMDEGIPSIAPTRAGFQGGFPTAAESSSPTLEASSQRVLSTTELTTRIPSGAPTVKSARTSYPSQVFEPTEAPIHVPDPTSAPTISFEPSDAPISAPSIAPIVRISSESPSPLPIVSSAPVQQQQKKQTMEPTERPTQEPTESTVTSTFTPSTGKPSWKPAPPSSLPIVSSAPVLHLKGQTMEPTERPTQEPSESPAFTPTFVPSTRKPSWKPTVAPSTSCPSRIPTFTPSNAPTKKPTVAPSTRAPSRIPTFTPSFVPTLAPSTLKPSIPVPTAVPSIPHPTAVPSLSRAPVGKWYREPTERPTHEPSDSPTDAPTRSFTPTELPTVTPTDAPSVAPSVTPSQEPSVTPSLIPTVVPSTSPTEAPTLSPTFVPTLTPSAVPSAMPTLAFPVSVQFNSQFRLSSYSGSVADDGTATLDKSSKMTIEQSIASVLQVNSSNVHVLSIQKAPSGGTSEQTQEPERHKKKTALLSCSIDVHFEVRASLNEHPHFGDNTTAFYNSMVTTLNTAVESGSMHNTVHTLAVVHNSTLITSSGINGLIVNPPVVIALKPTAMPTLATPRPSASPVMFPQIVPEDNTRMGIIVMACLGALICCLCTFGRTCRKVEPEPSDYNLRFKPPIVVTKWNVDMLQRRSKIYVLPGQKVDPWACINDDETPPPNIPEHLVFILPPPIRRDSDEVFDF